MKKVLPIFLFLLGALVLVGAYFFVIKGKREAGEMGDEEITLVEVPLEKRPITSLTPSEDGHWLKLNVEKIVIDAYSLDYLLVYEFPDPDTGEMKTNGVPGVIELKNQSVIVRDLLMGSESSGKYRYDEGVEKGTLTLKFRDENGKLVAKLSTDFHLQTGVSELKSVDNKFRYTLEEEKDVYFVTMEVFGIPEVLPNGVLIGPYGVFSSSEDIFPGEVILGGGPVYRWDGKKWIGLDVNSQTIGIFVGTP